MKRIMIMAIATMAMVGCTQNEDEFINNEPQEISFGAGISVVGARAAIESGDNKLPSTKVIGIQILRGADGETPAFDTKTDIITGDLETTGAISGISEAQYFDAAKTDANFIAYYPVGTVIAGKVSYTITGDEDIIAAPATKATSVNQKATFAFAHKLARVKLVVKAENAVAVSTFGDLTAATINVPTSLDMAIAAGGSATLAANATPVNADLSFGGATLSTGNENATKELMILPIAPTKINLEFANAAAKDYTISDLVLEAGKVTTITVTVKATGVSFDSTLDKWVDGGTNGSTEVN